MYVPTTDAHGRWRPGRASSVRRTRRVTGRTMQVGTFSPVRGNGASLVSIVDENTDSPPRVGPRRRREEGREMPWVEEWPSQGACRGEDPDALFVQGAAQQQAKQVCRGVPRPQRVPRARAGHPHGVRCLGRAPPSGSAASCSASTRTSPRGAPCSRTPGRPRGLPRRRGAPSARRASAPVPQPRRAPRGLLTDGADLRPRRPDPGRRRRSPLSGSRSGGLTTGPVGQVLADLAQRVEVGDVERAGRGEHGGHRRARAG